MPKTCKKKRATKVEVQKKRQKALCRRLDDGYDRVALFKIPRVDVTKLDGSIPWLGDLINKLQSDPHRPTFFDFRSPSEVRVYRLTDSQERDDIVRHEDHNALIVKAYGDWTFWLWREAHWLAPMRVGRSRRSVMCTLYSLLDDGYRHGVGGSLVENVTFTAETAGWDEKRRPAWLIAGFA